MAENSVIFFYFSKKKLIGKRVFNMGGYQSCKGTGAKSLFVIKLRQRLCHITVKGDFNPCAFNAFFHLVKKNGKDFFGIFLG